LLILWREDVGVTREQAIQQLADKEIIPCLSAGVEDAKEVLGICLNHDIPALLARPENCGHGCATKLELCVCQEDVPRVMGLLRNRWEALLQREGTLDEETQTATAGEDPPCPACGTVAPLQNGACTECGLQLE
jgi:hypothetical protein